MQNRETLKDSMAKHEGFIVTEQGLWYSIDSFDEIEPFLMSIVSPDDLWMFISSTGGLTAGRKNADHALFPYYTSDKITENFPNTGSQTIIRIDESTWQPFSLGYEKNSNIKRTLYKHETGNRIMFCEFNESYQLEFRYAWASSPRYGWVRSASLHNASGHARQIQLLDGVQNIVPANVSVKLQTNLSNLVDAYRLQELHENKVATFGLSSYISDKPLAHESLLVTSAWQTGLDDVEFLLSSEQIQSFYHTGTIKQEERKEGVRGAFFCKAEFTLESEERKQWMQVFEVDQSQSDVVNLLQLCKQPGTALKEAVNRDIEKASEQLLHLTSLSDGLQATKDTMIGVHHYTNTLFNIMRGGVFTQGYLIQKADLHYFVSQIDASLSQEATPFFDQLPQDIPLSMLSTVSNASQCMQPKNFQRLKNILYTYLPVSFSRRHGDPSRPWNTFSINLSDDQGNSLLDYEGNWRDIFQNWEALALSYPLYLPNMITTFANGITIDGYNPYRVTRKGFEWEYPEPENPWSHIGYWNDHQVIYGVKLLELAYNSFPDTFLSLLTEKRCTYVNVPYRIKSFEEIVSNNFDTIVFDNNLHTTLLQACKERGSSAYYLRDSNEEIIYSSILEKLLLILLVKTTNFVPDGGIWMNTQRPEWNDANNALAGKGMSMVTLYYLLRAVALLQSIIQEGDSSTDSVELHTEIVSFFEQVHATLLTFLSTLSTGFSAKTRYDFVATMGAIGSDYRTHCYTNADFTTYKQLSFSKIEKLLSLIHTYFTASAIANIRDDDLYHSYNVLHVENNKIHIKHLPLMLEGQVAALSSPLLGAEETITVVTRLKESKLYREDQNTYLLYPIADVKGFLQMNTLDEPLIQSSKLLKTLRDKNDHRLISKDARDAYHFNAQIANKEELLLLLQKMEQESSLKQLVIEERDNILSLYDHVFSHDSYTGRSNRMFAYEGNGSIYWHMVSKLVLSVQEQLIKASKQDINTETLSALQALYKDVRSGLGYQKDVKTYGAFPFDPYSHTPFGHGAKQPGLTGHVKEELLVRWTELGISYERGRLCFNSCLFEEDEYFEAESAFSFYDAGKQKRTLQLPSKTLAFTLCQTPVIYHKDAQKNFLIITYKDGKTFVSQDLKLSKKDTDSLISRDGTVMQINRFICNA